MELELDRSYRWNRLIPIGILLLVTAGLLMAVAWWIQTRPAAEPETAADDVLTAPQSQTETQQPQFTRVFDRPILAVDGTWAGSPHGLFRLTDAGEMEQVLPVSGDEQPLNVDAVHATDAGVYYSYTSLEVTRNDEGWHLAAPDGPIPIGTAFYDPATGESTHRLDVPAWDFAEYHETLYAIGNDGVFDVDSGERIGPPTTDNIDGLGFSLLATKNHLYAGTYEGVWRWNGVEWTHVLPMDRQKGLDFAQLNDTLYAIIGEKGIYRSEDGTDWEQWVSGLFNTLAVVDETLYVGGTDGIARLRANGTLETFINGHIYDLAVVDGALYVGTDQFYRRNTQ